MQSFSWPAGRIPAGARLSGTVVKERRHKHINSTKTKTKKPYPDFPLTAHPTGRWCKKIRGKIYYFGYIKDGWEAAVELYQAQRDDLYAGRPPRPPSDGLTIRDLCNGFIAHCDQSMPCSQPPRTNRRCER